MTKPKLASQTGKALSVLFIAFVFAQTTADVLFAASHLGGDFSVRYNEVECLRSGVNPFDVWSGRLRHNTYYSFHGKPEPGQTKMVHAYPPWEYTFFLPLSLLSKTAASRLYYGIQVVALAFVVIFLFQKGRSLKGRVFDGLFVTSCGLFLGGSMQSAFWFQQYGITNLALLVAMSWALDREQPILAALCWALVMAKPQVGLLLFIPLAIGRQWKTIVAAIILCCLTSLPPAFLCHVSPVDMILSLRFSAGDVLTGTAILPKPLFILLGRTVHTAFPASASAVVGIGLCVWLCWRFRAAESWLVKALPAVVCATGWTYLQLHDKTLFLFPCAVLGICLLQENRLQMRLRLAALLLLSATSLGAYVHARQTSWMHELGWFLPDGWPSKATYGLYVLGAAIQFFGFCLFLHWLSSAQSDNVSSLSNVLRFRKPECHT